jgi:hypothetical protein
VKVKDLITALQELDPDLLCCVMDQGGDWCTLDPPVVFNPETMSIHGFYNLDDPLPRRKHKDKFVAL